MKLFGYEVHPAAESFPMMSDDELRALADDIKKRGLLDPITLHLGQIVDGRNRATACEMAGVEPRFEAWTGSGSIIDWIVAKNVLRRHLDASQRAMAAARLEPLYAAEAKERQRGGQGGALLVANLPEANGRARDKAAAELNVSPRAVQTAKHVLANAEPGLTKAVERGDVAVSAAAALADEPAEKQRELVAAGPKAIKDAAREKRKPSPKLSAAERERLTAIAKGEEPEGEETPTECAHGRKPTLAPPCSGMMFARMAVMQLERISEDDSERAQAFEFVKEWVRKNEQR